MKNQFFILAFFAFCSFSCLGQTKLSKWSVGLDISGTSSQLSNVENTDQFPLEDYSRSGLGDSFGANLQRNLSNSFHLHVCPTIAVRLRDCFGEAKPL